VEHGGIPCCHILDVHEFAGQPIIKSYFNEKWRKQMLGEDALDDECYQIESANVLDEGHNSTPEPLGYGVHETIESLSQISQKNLYLTLEHLSV
jgi:hypothetical protein